MDDNVTPSEDKSDPDQTGVPPSDDTLPLNFSKDSKKKPERISRYTIIRELGRGSMGRVYLARDPGLDRDVAIKTMIAGEDASEYAIERFALEARSYGKLQHPHIVGVHEISREGAVYYMVMDYIPGRTLRETIFEKRLAFERSAEIIRDVARALDFVHEKGIVHRDIKPGNIIVRDDASICLMDFGLARNLQSDSSLTRTGQIVGTPLYLSPEQAEGEKDRIDVRSDIYSLGAVFYEMLTGKPPVEGDTLLRIVHMVLEEEPTPPANLDPSIPGDLEIICRKAMFKEPENRYQTAGELADDLTRYLEHNPIKARPPTLLYWLSKAVARNRKTLLVSLVLLVISGMGVVCQRWTARQDKDRIVEEMKKAEARTRKILDRIRKEERREWIAIYQENFNERTRLSGEWNAGAAGRIRNHALYIDGSAGGTIVWLDRPIIGEEWKFEYDGWVASEARDLNDIGLYVKADKKKPDWESGFEIQFGGKKNVQSGVFHQGREIVLINKPQTIQAGHKYHFEIAYRNGELSYTAVDLTRQEIIIDLKKKVPDINIPEDNQHQGFWTWGSQIYIDNIIISKPGSPEKKDALVVAEELWEDFGAVTAVTYLTNHIEEETRYEKKREYYLKALKITCNASRTEQNKLRLVLSNYYVKVFGVKLPSEVMDREHFEVFVQFFVTNAPEAGNELAVHPIMRQDVKIRKYLKRPGAEGKANGRPLKKHLKKNK